MHKANQLPQVINSAAIAQQSQIPSAPVNMGPQIPMPVPAPQSQPMSMGNNFPTVGDIDLRPVDPRLNRNMDQDMRALGLPNNIGVPNVMDMNFRNQRPNTIGPVAGPVFQNDPRQRPIDPRQKANPNPLPQQSRGGMPTGGIPNDASDQEKAALIMQVLQLSDEQIAQLPPEQRTSILVLKEQIAKSTQR